jgi:hypothetical protein
MCFFKMLFKPYWFFISLKITLNQFAMKQFILFPFILIALICAFVYAWWPESNVTTNS